MWRPSQHEPREIRPEEVNGEEDFYWEGRGEKDLAGCDQVGCGGRVCRVILCFSFEEFVESVQWVFPRGA